MSIKQLLYRLLREQNPHEEEEELDTIPTAVPLAQTITFNLLAIGLIVALVVSLQSLLVPIILAIILAVVLYPLSEWFERRGFNRAMSSFTSLLIGLAIFAGIAFVLVKQTINIGQDATEIVGKIQTVLERGEAWANDVFHLSKSEIITQGKAQLNKMAPDITAFVSGFFGSLGSFLSLGVLLPLMIFFFLYYRDFFKSFFIRAFRNTPKEKLELTFTKMYEALKNYLGGMIMVMGIIAILNSVGLWIMGIEYAWFFGILAALLMLLPYIGIAIGSILPALFALATKDSYWYAVGVIAWFQVVQMLEANIITPNIVGSKVSLNPLVSILSIFLFSMLFGFAGLILALPIMAVLKVIFDAVPQLRPYGFLLSEPKKKYLTTERQKLKPSKKTKEEIAKEAAEAVAEEME